LNNILKAIEGLKKKVENVPVLVEESCVTIAQKANSQAPIGISVYANGNTVTASGPLAAYREFGTGLAEKPYDADTITGKLPQEWDEYAWSFVVNEKGTLKGSPYLFPAYESERLELIKKIKQSFEGR
jgi:hypothetical protein